MEQRIERVEERLYDLDVVLDAAESGERVAHELQAGDLGGEAVDQQSVGGELEQPEVVPCRLPECAAEDGRVEADAYSGLPAVDDLVGELRVGDGGVAAIRKELGFECGDSSRIDATVSLELACRESPRSARGLFGLHPS